MRTMIIIIVMRKTYASGRLRNLTIGIALFTSFCYVISHRIASCCARCEWVLVSVLVFVDSGHTQIVRCPSPIALTTVDVTAKNGYRYETHIHGRAECTVYTSAIREIANSFCEECKWSQTDKITSHCFAALWRNRFHLTWNACKQIWPCIDYAKTRQSTHSHSTQ